MRVGDKDKKTCNKCPFGAGEYGVCTCPECQFPDEPTPSAEEWVKRSDYVGE